MDTTVKPLAKIVTKHCTRVDEHLTSCLRQLPVLVVDVGLDSAGACAVEEEPDALVRPRPLHDGRVQRRAAVVVLAVRVRT